MRKPRDHCKTLLNTFSIFKSRINNSWVLEYLENWFFWGSIKIWKSQMVFLILRRHRKQLLGCCWEHKWWFLQRGIEQPLNMLIRALQITSASSGRKCAYSCLVLPSPSWLSCFSSCVIAAELVYRGWSGEKEKPPLAAAAQTDHEPASLNIIFKQFHHCRPGSELGNCSLFLTEWDLEQGGFCSRLEVFSLAASEIFERSNLYLMGRREAQSSCLGCSCLFPFTEHH